MIANDLLWKRIVINVCNAVSAKFANYYSRTENDGGLIYNLANVLDFTMKFNLYKVWDRQKNAFSTHYQNKYKKKTANIFVNITKIQRSIQNRYHEKHKILTK